MGGIHRFFCEYPGNGELQTTNPLTGAVLSRKDAYIPMNMIVNSEGCRDQIACMAEADRRQILEGGASRQRDHFFGRE